MRKLHITTCAVNSYAVIRFQLKIELRNDFIVYRYLSVSQQGLYRTTAHTAHFSHQKWHQLGAFTYF